MERVAIMPGRSAVDFNVPGHLDGLTPHDVRWRLDYLRLGLNGLAMRSYSDPGSKLRALARPGRAHAARP